METSIAIGEESSLCSCYNLSLDVRFDANAWGIPQVAVDELDKDFEMLCNRYTPLLVTKTRDTSLYGKAYISGLLRNEKTKRTFKGISNTTGVSEQNLHHFMSNSPWQAQPVIRQIQSDIAILCQDDPIEGCSLRLNASFRYKTEVATILEKLKQEVKIQQVASHKGLRKYQK